MPTNYFFRIHSSPIIQNINNSTLSGAFSMPVADQNMNRENDFAMNRHLYLNVPLSSPVQEKKWMGNTSRDSSSLTANRRARAIGQPSVNEVGKPQSFVSNHEKNTRIEALARVRGSGSVVPPKVRHSPLSTNNIAVFGSTIKYQKKGVLPFSESRLYMNKTFCEKLNCLPEYSSKVEKYNSFS